MTWLYHDSVLFNLEKYSQICRGDEDEILLSTESHTNDWNDESKYASLKFENKAQRDYILNKIIMNLTDITL